MISTLAVFSGMLGTVKAAGTTTVVTVSVSPVCANNLVTVTATVTGDTTPTGTITWSTNTTGTFGEATSTLNGSGQASTTYVDSIAGHADITASYSGDANGNDPSSSDVKVQICKIVDFNHDGVVNFKDIVVFASAYIAAHQSKPYDSECNLNHDGSFNFVDIQAFASDYVAAANNLL